MFYFFRVKVFEILENFMAIIGHFRGFQSRWLSTSGITIYYLMAIEYDFFFMVGLQSLMQEVLCQSDFTSKVQLFFFAANVSKKRSISMVAIIYVFNLTLNNFFHLSKMIPELILNILILKWKINLFFLRLQFFRVSVYYIAKIIGTIQSFTKIYLDVCTGRDMIRFKNETLFT